MTLFKLFVTQFHGSGLNIIMIAFYKNVNLFFTDNNLNRLVSSPKIWQAI